MSASSNDSGDGNAGAIHDAPLDLSFQLPVEPGYRELPPKGSWEAGYELSLLALEFVKDRPEIWEQRRARVVNVEFVMRWGFVTLNTGNEVASAAMFVLWPLAQAA